MFVSLSLAFYQFSSKLIIHRSILYATDERDSQWSADRSHRWSRSRYASFWTHGHSQRISNHMGQMSQTAPMGFNYSRSKSVAQSSNGFGAGGGGDGMRQQRSDGFDVCSTSRAISPERHMDGNSACSNGVWNQDFSPVGKIKRMRAERNASVEVPLQKRVHGEQLMERKKIKRLMQTRFWDDFHPSKYYFKPSTWDEGKDKRVMTAPVIGRIPADFAPKMGNCVETSAEAKSPIVLVE